MLAISCLVFIFGSTIVTDKQEEKSKKRRLQNVNSAKKSYDSKKKQRQNLEQKNAELEEVQKRLLHSKFRLEAILRLLQYVAETMDHAYSTCTSSSNEQAKSQTEASNCITSANPQTDINVCCDLDLCASRKLSSCHNDTLFKYNQHNPEQFYDAKNAPQVDRNNSRFVENRSLSMKVRVLREVGLATGVPKGNLLQDVDKIKKEVDLQKESDIKQEVHSEYEIDIPAAPKKLKLEVNSK